MTTHFTSGVTNVATGGTGELLKQPDPIKYHVYHEDFDKYTASDWVITTTEGGSGDLDLLVKFGAEPVIWNKDCYSANIGNDETCTIENTQAGTYFIKLREDESYSNVRLIAVSE